MNDHSKEVLIKMLSMKYTVEEIKNTKTKSNAKPSHSMLMGKLYSLVIAKVVNEKDPIKSLDVEILFNNAFKANI